MPRRPPRIAGYPYRGVAACFLTACTANRVRAFSIDDFAAAAASQLLQHAGRFHVAVTAYCLMPDHVHVLLSAVTDAAEPLKCFESWKQWTGFQWRRRKGGGLWQQGYWDYVLRHDEALLDVAAYVVNNPVRAELVTNAFDHPYQGSSIYTRQQLAEAAQWRPPRRG